MTHPVNLKPGMTAIRRDGERSDYVLRNRVSNNKNYVALIFLKEKRLDLYKNDGTPLLANSFAEPIIAAGYPWAELGAQVGDTVCRVWDNGALDDYSFVVRGMDKGGNTSGLCVIEARAAKPADSEIEWGEWKIGGAPINSDAMQIERIGTIVRHRLPKQKFADRPSAAHKLNLRDGDVVELVAWECDCSGHYAVGDKFTVPHGILARAEKGHRPLFRLISRDADSYGLSDMPEFRAADAKQKPDNPPARRQQLVAQGGGFYRTMAEAQVRAQVAADAKLDEVQLAYGGEYKYTCTFPHGSNTGTVEREAL